MRIHLLLAIYLAAFSSCSSVKLARSFADWYLNSEIDDAFDLNSKQEVVIEERVDNHLIWLDRELIPEIIRYTELIGLQVDKKITPKNVDDLYTHYEFLRVMLISEIADDAGWLLANLSSKQKKHFARYLDKRNDELNEQLALPEGEFIKTVNEKRIENIEQWFGELEKEQIAQIKKLWPADKSKFKQWRDARKSQHDSLLAFVGQSQKTVSAKLIAWAKEPSLLLSAEQKIARKNMRSETSRRIVDIFKIFNVQQRLYFKTKLAKLSQDLKELVKK